MFMATIVRQIRPYRSSNSVGRTNHVITQEGLRSSTSHRVLTICSSGTITDWVRISDSGVRSTVKVDRDVVGRPPLTDEATLVTNGTLVASYPTHSGSASRLLFQSPSA